MRAALFDAAEADGVALPGALFVVEVANQVIELRAAAAAGAYGVEPFFDVAVLRAERAATVLAAIYGGGATTEEAAADLAVTGHEWCSGGA